uniref:Uncharacterized protein n=1 Tax=Romanomermis culicivorax TaxID=13658 RepID=A0A915J5Q6_ROMCU
MQTDAQKQTISKDEFLTGQQNSSFCRHCQDQGTCYDPTETDSLCEEDEAEAMNDSALCIKNSRHIEEIGFEQLQVDNKMWTRKIDVSRWLTSLNAQVLPMGKLPSVKRTCPTQYKTEKYNMTLKRPRKPSAKIDPNNGTSTRSIHGNTICCILKEEIHARCEKSRWSQKLIWVRSKSSKLHTPMFV